MATGTDYTAQLANVIAGQNAQLQIDPSLGAMQQTGRMPYQPSNIMSAQMPMPPQQSQAKQSSAYNTGQATNPAQTLRANRMLQNADRNTGNVAMDNLARRHLEQRAFEQEDAYAKEQQQLALQDAEKQARAAKDAALKLGDDAYYAVLEMTGGDKNMASEVAHMMTSDPQAARSIIAQMAEKKYDTSKAAVTNVNLPPPQHYQWTDETHTKLEPIEGGEVWQKNQEAQYKATQMAIDQNQTSQLITNQIGKIREEIDTSFLPATGAGGAAVRAFAQAISPTPRDGDVPLFESAFGAGEVARRNEVVKGNIALGAINNMRSFSPNGGALGNVSNFEVRLVQNVKDALDPTRGKEAYLDALNTVEMVQKRSAYLARHGDDMMAKAAESGTRPEVFIMDILNSQFPIDEQFTQGIIDEDTGWDGLAPMEIPEDNTQSDGQQSGGQQQSGWSIKKR